MAQATISEALLFADVESVVTAFLAARPELDGVPVVVALPPDFDGTRGLIRVTRFGGAFSEDDRLDEARVRLDAYAQDKASAHALACAVRGLMPALPRAARGDGVVVTDVAENDGPYWHPDRRRGDASRYLIRYRIAIEVRPRAA